MPDSISHPPPALTPVISTKDLTQTDLEGIARIHIESFADSAWTKLGFQVVKQYYDWQLTGPHPHVLAKGVYLDGEFVGFCIAGVFKGSTMGFIWNNRFLLAGKIILKPWLLLGATFRQSFLSGYRLLKKYSPDKLTKSREAKSFGILALATHPKYQSYGIGRLLMQEAEKEAFSTGFKKMHLTVNPANTKAVNFYAKQNWEKVLVDNRWKGAMKKTLSLGLISLISFIQNNSNSAIL